MKGRDLTELAKNLNALMDSNDKGNFQENDYPCLLGSTDAIERALQRFLTLTREKAEALAEFNGF